MKTTEWRAKKAHKVLEYHNDLLGMSEEIELNGIGMTDVADLLADLRHYCDMHGIDFYEASDTSMNLYLEELHNNEEVTDVST